MRTSNPIHKYIPCIIREHPEYINQEDGYRSPLFFSLLYKLQNPTHWLASRTAYQPITYFLSSYPLPEKPMYTPLLGGPHTHIKQQVKLKFWKL
jgi:hypothetical protein